MTTFEQLLAYAEQLFAPEDDGLREVRSLQRSEGLPDIAVSPIEGKILHLLLRAVGARRVLEVGTLGGYSTAWMARALPAGGRLITIEADPRHAAVARRALALAGVGDRVDVVEGRALDVLPGLAPGFDAVFLDADKEPLEQYFHHAMRLLRRGGWLLCDNTFLHGRVLEEQDRSADVEGMRTFNRLVAADPRLVGAAIPVRDGLLAALKVGD
jgi:predicted O-methyltransferase YrrM